MSAYEQQIADRLEQFAETIVNVNDPTWYRETFAEELRTIRTLANCTEDDALMRRVSEGIDELLRPLHPHAAPFLVPGCADTNLKRACAIAEQAKALALELRGAADDGAAAKADDLPVLSEYARAVYEILLGLKPHEAMIGPKIVDALNKRNIYIDESTFRSRIVKELKPYGIENTPRKGYYVPASKRPPQNAT